MNLPDNNFKWVDKIKANLTTVGRPDLWENQFQINSKTIHKEIKRILIGQFNQDWHSQQQNSNKGRTYIRFKGAPELELYFKLLNKIIEIYSALEPEITHCLWKAEDMTKSHF